MKKNKWFNLFGGNNSEEQEFKQCVKFTDNYFDESGDLRIIETTVCAGNGANNLFRERLDTEEPKLEMCSVTYTSDGSREVKCAELPRELDWYVWKF